MNFENIPRNFETFGELENFCKDERNFENVPKNLENVPRDLENV